MVKTFGTGLAILAVIVWTFLFIFGLAKNPSPKQSCINGYVHEEFVSESFIRKTSQECTKTAEE